MITQVLPWNSQRDAPLILIILGDGVMINIIWFWFRLGGWSLRGSLYYFLYVVSWASSGIRLWLEHGSCRVFFCRDFFDGACVILYTRDSLWVICVNHDIVVEGFFNMDADYCGVFRLGAEVLLVALWQMIKHWNKWVGNVTASCLGLCQQRRSNARGCRADCGCLCLMSGTEVVVWPILSLQFLDIYCRNA